jgi:hypothetical protein
LVRSESAFHTRISKRSVSPRGSMIARLPDLSQSPEGSRDGERAAVTCDIARVRCCRVSPPLDLTHRSGRWKSIRRCGRIKESAEADTKSRPQMRQRHRSDHRDGALFDWSEGTRRDRRLDFPNCSPDARRRRVCRSVAGTSVPSNSATRTLMKRRE